MPVQLKSIQGGKKRLRDEINLIQMQDNEKALLLSQRYDGICIHPESGGVLYLSERRMEIISTLQLSREMAVIYNEHQTNFGKGRLTTPWRRLKW